MNVLLNERQHYILVQLENWCQAPSRMDGAFLSFYQGF